MILMLLEWSVEVVVVREIDENIICQKNAQALEKRIWY